MITRNINDDNTLSYLFNSNSKAVKKTDEKVDAADKKIDSLEQSFGDEIERLETLIGEVGIPSGGSIGQYLVKSSADDYAVGWESHGMDLLWENASPPSDFAAQTITLDLSPYNFIDIGFYWYIGNSDYGIFWQRFKVGFENKQYAFRADNSAWIDIRELIVSTTGVTFSASKESQGTGSTSNNNSATIPYQIYGIR